MRKRAIFCIFKISYENFKVSINFFANSLGYAPTRTSCMIFAFPIPVGDGNFILDKETCYF